MKSRLSNVLKSIPEDFIFYAKAMTQSMEPVIRVGDTVGVKKTKFKRLKIGDIIAFSKLNKRYPVIHRISRKLVRRGEILLITKGDNIKFEDGGVVSEINYLGKVVTKKTRNGREIKLIGVRGKIAFFLLGFDYKLATSKNIPELNLGIRDYTRHLLQRLLSLLAI